MELAAVPEQVIEFHTESVESGFRKMTAWQNKFERMH